MATRYPGVSVRGNSIVLAFTYNNQRCRETFNIGRSPTNTMLDEASQLLAQVKWEIGTGRFDYLKYFPNSRTKIAKQASCTGDRITIEQQLKRWLVRKGKVAQRSTMKGYESAVYYHLIPQFGNLKLSELKPTHVRDWISSLDISAKRINNTLIPLRQSFREAYEDEIIDSDPMDRIKNLSLETREPEPFSLQEIEAILSKLKGQERNLIQFAFWSGLRTSELIALEWQDVDFENDRIYIRRAKVAGQIKITKTKSGFRTVELNDRSADALRNQRMLNPEHEVVFLDEKHSKPWNCDQWIRKRVWIPALRKADIKYRNPYQSRHTYASVMLTWGKDPTWLAAQMGHKDWGMIRTVYARWLNQI